MRCIWPASLVYTHDLLLIVQMVNALLIHVRSLSVWRGLVLLGRSLHI
jgi:hypothetical protein